MPIETVHPIGQIFCEFVFCLMYMSDKLCHIVQYEIGWLHTGKFQTEVYGISSVGC